MIHLITVRLMIGSTELECWSDLTLVGTVIFLLGQTIIYLYNPLPMSLTCVTFMVFPVNN